MTDIIDELRAEHATMQKLLTILERQVAAFNEGDRPDYEIVEAVVEYFLDYPDQCHHPKEDLVARKLLEDAANAPAALNQLEAQHEELGALSRRFAKVLRRVLDEAELPRQEFVRAAKEFIDSQRHHIQMEEEYFFPAAQGALSRDDLAEIDARLFEMRDPLTGDRVEERYAALRDDILKWEQAGS